MNPILQIYATYGTADYIGENLSQIQHALLAAYIAGTMRPDDHAFIIAALLHDIGHILPDNAARTHMDGFGIADHEHIGARYLADYGMPARVCTLVSNHVAAKRYLVASDKDYYESLSDASKHTLAAQGGPMTLAEITAFELMPDFHDILLIRRIDELAKNKNDPHHSLEYYSDIINRLLEPS
jgi:2-amino-1-hydroxyethylphosphonate dioxygenase (glycine-forming)